MREMQVLTGMSQGKSNAQIGRELYLSEDTIKTHARRLFRKLGAKDRAEAVATGFRRGMMHVTLRSYRIAPRPGAVPLAALSALRVDHAAPGRLRARVERDPRQGAPCSSRTRCRAGAPAVLSPRGRAAAAGRPSGSSRSAPRRCRRRSRWRSPS